MSPPRLRFVMHGSFILPVLFALTALSPLWSNGIEGPGNPRIGRDLFVGKGCIRCHSIGESSGKKGPSLASVGMGRNLYELCASLWSHWSRMNALLVRDKQPRNSLTAAEFRDIIAYLYYLNYNSESGDPASGEDVFLKKGCIKCHVTEPLEGAKKQKPGRPVYEMVQFQTPVNLAVGVWNHGPGMFRTMSTESMRWPEFQDKEVTHLVAFIRSRNGAPRDSDMVPPGDPSRGQVLFAAKSCVSCHKYGIKAAPAPNFAATGKVASVSALIASLWNHYPKMSEAISTSGVRYSKIEREEMADLLAYIYWLKASGLAGNPAAGRNLYESKLCSSCHSPSGPKASSAPSLMRSEATDSAYALLAAIWNHGPRMESLLRERNIPWPSLTGEEMRNLVAYLRK